MTKDLEKTLRELGDGYRPVVERLLAAYTVEKRSDLLSTVPAGGPRAGRTAAAVGWGVALLSAAALLVFLGLGVVFRGGEPAKVYTVRVTDAANEYRLAVVRDDAAVREMIRTQRPDGGWGSEFLTRRNAAALKDCSDAAAQLAYRKAMRNLRLRGRL